MQLGWNEYEEARLDDALVCFQRAEEALRGLVHDPRNLGAIISIDESRRAIAWLLGRSRREEPRRRLLESHIRMLERLSDRAGGDPALGLLAALVRSDLAAVDSASAMLGAKMQLTPASKRPSERFEWRVAESIAHDVQPDLAGPNSTGEPKSRLDPNAHAHAVIQALESRCEALGVYPALLPSAARHVATIASIRAVEQRAGGRLDDARLTAACLSAFAKKLVHRDPAEAWFHVILSEACAQEAKNAWKVEDFPTIEAATRNALVAASTALHLDPRNEEARLKVSVLQDKLVGLASRQPPSQ